MTIREILNELRWRGDRDFSRLLIRYIHRGAANNKKELRGEDIKGIKRSYIETEDALIPYHRVIEILYNGKVVYKKRSRATLD